MRTLRPIHALPLLALAAALPRPAAAQSEWLENCRRNSNRNHERVSVCDERETRIAAPRLLSVDGKMNGGISVKAWDGADVLVRERIQAWGETASDAQAVTRDIRVHTADGQVYADGPQMRDHRGWAVTYEIMVPRRMDLRLVANNGPVGVDGVAGQMDIRTQNGPLTLRQTSGDVTARTVNGPLTVALAGTQWDGRGLNAQTTNGPVTVDMPAGYNTVLTAGTVNGPMNVDFPVTVQGRMTRQITSTIGRGGAPVRVTTTNGPVNVRRR